MASATPMSPGSSQGGSRRPRDSSDAGSDTDTVVSVPQSSTMHRMNLTSLPGAGVSLLALPRYDSQGADGPGGSTRSSTSLKGFNAISTVLNHPTKRPQPIDPKSSRYPALPNANAPDFELPKVRRADYESYIQSVGKQWGSWKNNRDIGTTGTATLGGTAPEGSRGTERVDLGVRASLDESATIATRKRLAPLSAVPQVFFGEDFSLGNPYTFDIVTERYKSGPDGTHAPAPSLSGAVNAVTSSGYDPALNAMLQEKLSYYSDVIEQHLTLEIRTRSASFFHALTNLQELEAEGKACVEQIDELKRELSAVESGVVLTGLETIRLQDKRRETRRKLRATAALEETVRKRDLADMMVRQGQYEEALDMIESVERDLQPRLPPSPRLPQRKLSDDRRSSAEDLSVPAAGDGIEISTLRAMGGVALQLSHMREAIGGQIEAEFFSVLESNLKGTVAPNALTNGAAASELRERLAPLLLGLSRSKTVKAAVARSREIDKQAIRERLNTTIDQFAKDELDEKSGSFGPEDAAQPFETVAASLRDLASVLDSDGAAARNAESSASAVSLRLFPHSSYIHLSQLLFDSLLACLRAIDDQNHAIAWTLGNLMRGGAPTNALSTPGDTVSTPTTPSGEASIPSALSDIQSSLVDYVHMLLSRFVHLRGASNIALSFDCFLEVFVPSWTFIKSSEALAHRTVMGFRNTLLGQAKTWLSNFHRERIERAARAVEEEMWGQTDVDAQRQRVVKDIVLAATHSPKALIRSPTLADTEAPAGPEDDEPPSEEKAANLVIEENSFSVVGACLVVLDMLAEYLQVVLNLPLLATDAMSKVTELLKQFNSRTCQVVLGAGAMRSAGLRNITAKHLALASQSLSIMITLIPYVRETVRRHLTPQQAVMLTEFDKMKRDYQEHQYEIHAKLVAIMSDRLTVHCRSLNAVDWNVPTTTTPPEPNKYAADLVKETATLHKVLTRYLQPAVVSAVIGQVLKAIDARVAAEFANVEVQNQAAKDRLEADKTLMDRKLGSLANVEWNSSTLTETLEKKTVPPPAPPPPEPKTEPAQAVTSPTGATPAYKPRIAGLFARRAQQASGSSATSASTETLTPPNGRASTDSASGPTTDQGVDKLVDKLTNPDSTSLSVPSREETSTASGNASPPPPSPPQKDTVRSSSEGSSALPKSDGTSHSPARVPNSNPTIALEGDVSAADVAASTEDRVTTSTEDGPAMTSEPDTAPASSAAVDAAASIEPTESADDQEKILPATSQAPASEITSPTQTNPDPAPPAVQTHSPSSQSQDPPPGPSSSRPSGAPRMSLRERLAEAASRRSAAAAHAASASSNSASTQSTVASPRDDAMTNAVASPHVSTEVASDLQPQGDGAVTTPVVQNGNALLAQSEDQAHARSESAASPSSAEKDAPVASETAAGATASIVDTSVLASTSSLHADTEPAMANSTELRNGTITSNSVGSPIELHENGSSPTDGVDQRQEATDGVTADQALLEAEDSVDPVASGLGEPSEESRDEAEDQHNPDSTIADGPVPERSEADLSVTAEGTAEDLADHVQNGAMPGQADIIGEERTKEAQELEACTGVAKIDEVQTDVSEETEKEEGGEEAGVEGGQPE